MLFTLCAYLTLNNMWETTGVVMVQLGNSTGMIMKHNTKDYLHIKEDIFKMLARYDNLC